MLSCESTLVSLRVSPKTIAVWDKIKFCVWGSLRRSFALDFRRKSEFSFSIYSWFYSYIHISIFVLSSLCAFVCLHTSYRLLDAYISLGINKVIYCIYLSIYLIIALKKESETIKCLYCHCGPFLTHLSSASSAASLSYNKLQLPIKIAILMIHLAQRSSQTLT